MVNGNSEKVTPKYWQIFINTNTRYATAYPLEDKTNNSIKKNLERLLVMNYLKQNKCGVFIVQEQLHSTLGIIDRAIRTLRDMNTPQEKPLNADSSDKQFKYISTDKMKCLLESYNNDSKRNDG